MSNYYDEKMENKLKNMINNFNNWQDDVGRKYIQSPISNRLGYSSTTYSITDEMDSLENRIQAYTDIDSTRSGQAVQEALKKRYDKALAYLDIIYINLLNYRATRLKYGTKKKET